MASKEGDGGLLSAAVRHRVRNRVSLSDVKTDLEVEYLKEVLAQCGGNKARAADCAGIDRSNFRRLLRKHGMFDVGN